MIRTLKVIASASCALMCASGVFAQVSALPASLPECELDVAKVQILTAVRVVQTSQYVRGLAPENFRVSSNKEVFDLQCFSGEDGPLAIGIVTDHSDSMSDRSVDLFVSGIRAFLKAANPENTYFGVGFGKDAFSMLEPTSDPARVETYLEKTAAQKQDGKTSLNDAVQFAMSKFPPNLRLRRVLFVATDGEDNNSKANTQRIAKELRRSGVRVYLFKPNESGKKDVYNVDGFAEDRLSGYAGETGGAWVVYSKWELPDGYLERLSKRLRREYTLGFTPSKAEDKWRQVVVEVKVPADFPAIRSTGSRWFHY